MLKNTYFTSEAVSCGHPDKICDQISDAILDEFLKQDSKSKVAVECFITNNLLVIGGEAHSHADVDVVGIAKKILTEIGYDGTNGFDPESAVFLNTLHEQSPDIRQGVDKNNEYEQGAGDQGIMFGYASNEISGIYMPAAIVLANRTMRVYDTLRKYGRLPGMRPDAKCQYTLKYDNNGNATIDTIVISMQHDENVSHQTLYDYVAHKIIPSVKEDSQLSGFFNDSYTLFVNPTGKFVIGGPQGDTGLTGRKIIVDTYGGACPHGGGAFSGKDASKVDRSAAYMARYIAKNIVAAEIADEVTVQLSYGIGLSEPISVHVDTVNPAFKNSTIEEMIKKVFPLTPYGIIKHLSLKESNYLDTATYGHFGRNDFTWEKVDKVKEIKSYFSIKD